MAALKGRQKIQPAALNKSGPLRQAAGFLTNAAANVAMALTVFIASSTPRSTNPQVKETLMAEPLSPAAQAVLSAFGKYPLHGDHIAENLMHGALPAALRAVVEQLGYSNVPEEFAHLRPLVIDSDDLLAIAAELEGQ